MTKNTSHRNCRAGERGVTVGEAKNIREERQRRSSFRKGIRNNRKGKLRNKRKIKTDEKTGDSKKKKRRKREEKEQ
jgi:hypothetical protein